MGTDLAITLLISALNHASEIGALISRARAEGRDVSDAEIDALLAQDDAAKAKLAAHIQQAKSEGR